MTDRLKERMVEIADRDDTTGLAADALREVLDRITQLEAATEWIAEQARQGMATTDLAMLGSILSDIEANASLVLHQGDRKP